MKRSYRQHCGVAKALDVVGERWSLLILRDLLLGPRRYGQILEALPGLTTNLLADRLNALAAAGLLVHDDQSWALSDEGLAIEPVIMALGKFGERYLQGWTPSSQDRFDIGRALLSLKRRYVPGALDFVVGFQMTKGRSFELADIDGRLSVEERAPSRGSALVVEGSTAAFRRWLFGRGAGAGLVFTGTMSAKKRLLMAFDG